jgi:hypothetical protein
MKARLSLIICAAAFVAGCGSASDSVTFQAPSSYHSKASIGPFMQVWSREPHTALVLISLPVQTDLDQAMSRADVGDARVQKKERIKICNGTQGAILAQLEGNAKTDPNESDTQPSEIQFLATNVRGKTYMAMYARPLHSTADPTAEAAIRNVCPK